MAYVTYKVFAISMGAFLSAVVVPVLGWRGWWHCCVSCHLAGGGGHGKIPPVVGVILHSNDNASHCSPCLIVALSTPPATATNNKKGPLALSERKQ